MAKATVESCASINIRQWHRIRKAGMSTWNWAVGEQGDFVSVAVLQSRFLLTYQVQEGGKWEPIEESIYTDETTSAVGGKRQWFRCPRCGRRVAVLYAGTKYFRCRRCLGLVYGSQHENPFWRAVRRARRNRAKLGGSPSLYAPFPAKPPYMHWKAYDRMMEEERKVFLESTKWNEASLAAAKKRVAERLSKIESAASLPAGPERH
jgi:hypothetical protein